VSRRGLRAAAFLVAGLASVAVVHAADPPPPDITGVWSGEGPVVLAITDQLGTAFDATLLADGRERPIYGVIQRDRREIMFINPEGNRRGELVAPERMSFCLEARDDFRFEGPCVLLSRTPLPD
jgi:hypothetical protein